MAWTTPRTWVASETVTASVMNTHVRDNFDFWATTPNELRISRTTSQTISTNTETSVTFNSETTDVGFGFTPSASTMTIPETGIYAISYQTTWAGSAGNPSFGGISLDGTLVFGHGGDTPNNNNLNSKTGSMTRRLTSGTVVRIRVWHLAGVNQDLNTPINCSIVQVQRTTS